jgi:MoaA/NifB/PqqE/SkfB family radical SAM enzyme/glycosyltransferase involved in cell wall biosynthesis
LTRGDLFPTDHGAAVKIVRTAEALSIAGEPCCVVTDDPAVYLRFVDGVCQRVAYPPKVRAAQEWPLVRRGGRFAEGLLGRLGYPAEEYFLYRPMFDVAWWMRAIAVGELEGITVFQAEFPGYGVPAWVASRFCDGATSSVVQHNVEWERLGDFGHDVSKIRAIEQFVLGRVDDVIAVSVDDKARMVNAGTEQGKITVIPHGVDLARFGSAVGADIRSVHGIAATAPLLFFHGTLHYWPNTQAVRFIVEKLLPVLLASKPDLRIIIAGQNPPKYYEHPAVVTPGSVDRLEDYIAAADVCVCPVFAGGGTRMKLLEYMAAGAAVVSSTKGAEGIQYRPGVELEIADDAQAMAHLISALIDDPSRRASLGRAARNFARAYDWSAVAEASLKMYGGDGRGEDWNPRFSAAQRPIVDAHLPADRVMAKPLTMLLLINRGCNLRCSFCDLWADPEHMDVPGRLIPLLDQAVAIGTKTLVITGGEPFMHPDLFVAVAAAKARGMSVNITTNGTLIDKRFDELVASGVDSLSFSIDGLGPTHDELRGQIGAFKRTMKGLKRVRQTLPEMAVSIYCVVTAKNVGELTDVFALAQSHGAQFDFWPVNDAPDLYLKTPKDRATWASAVAEIAQQDLSVAARAEYYGLATDYHAGGLGTVRCLGLVEQYGVTYQGDLIPCCVWGKPELVVGNVFEQPLSELWASNTACSVRTDLFRDGCAVGCYNHSLYEFELGTGMSFQLPELSAT